MYLQFKPPFGTALGAGLALSTLLLLLTLSACGGCGEKKRVTSPGDTTAPTVASAAPAAGATNVAVTTNVTAAFSEDVATASVNTSTFTLAGPTGQVAGDVSSSGSTATFVPSSMLEASTNYTATLTTGVTDVAGNALANSVSWTFTTAEAADETPPTVGSTSPTAGATNVAVTTNVTAAFSEDLATASVNTSTFTLAGPTGQVAGDVSSSGSTATFVPGSSLTESATYTATLTTGITDAAGNNLASIFSWTFTTAEAADETPPTVGSTSPAAGATNVPVTTNVTANFSEALAASSVNASTFTLTGPAGQVAGNVSASVSTATFVPASSLTASTTYTAALTTGITDEAGNALASNFTWTFITAAPADETPPTVQSTSPTSGATDVPVSTAITATFSEAIAVSSVNASSFTLSGPGGQVAGTVSASGSTATLVPGSPLNEDAGYTATLTTGITDMAGNPLTAPFTWSFTTQAAPDNTPPTVVKVFPEDGEMDWEVDNAVGVRFSETIDFATVTASTFTLVGPSGPVPGTYSLVPGEEVDGDPRPIVALTPPSPLSEASLYTATVTTGIRDLAGNALATSFSWTFTTESLGTGSIAFINVAPVPGSIDAFVDRSRVVEDLAFEQGTSPLTVATGSHEFAVTAAGSLDDGYSETRTVAADDSYTGFAFYSNLDQSLLFRMIQNDVSPVPSGSIRLRFINVAGDFQLNLLDVELLDGTTLDANLGWNEVGDLLEIGAGAYTLKVGSTAVPETTFMLPDLLSGTVANVFIVSGPQRPLFLVIYLIDGATVTVNPSAPLVLEKSNWQIDLTYAGGSFRLEAEIDQNGNVLTGSSRDNNQEVDVETMGSIVGSSISVSFVMSNGGSPRGEFTCTGTISSGSPQTITGTFTSPDGSFLGGASGPLSGSFTMQ